MALPDPVQPGSPERTRHWISRTQVLSCHSQPQLAKFQAAALPAFCVSYQLHQEIQFVKLCFLAQPSAEIATLSMTLVTRPKVRKYTWIYSLKNSEKCIEARCFLSKWQRSWEQKVGGTILKDPLGLLSQYLRTLLCLRRTFSES